MRRYDVPGLSLAIAKDGRLVFAKGYAKGWSVNRAHNWWHTGSLPGTYSELVRAQNGFCWAIVMNQRRPDKSFAAAVDQLGWKILAGVKSWPADDLF